MFTLLRYHDQQHACKLRIDNHPVDNIVHVKAFIVRDGLHPGSRKRGFPVLELLYISSHHGHELMRSVFMQPSISLVRPVA